MSDKNISYWKVEKDDNNIAWLHFDTPDATANLLCQAAIEELNNLLKGFEETPPKALIILSDKKDSFIFGADIKEFTILDNLEIAKKFLQNGHDLMNRLEATPFPTVSMVMVFFSVVVQSCLWHVTILSPAMIKKQKSVYLK